MAKQFGIERILDPYNELAEAFAQLEAEHEDLVKEVKALHTSVESLLADSKFVARINKVLATTKARDAAKTDGLVRVLKRLMPTNTE